MYRMHVLPTITVTDLRKHYGEIRAVDGVSFEVEQGEFVGILGPNGAGKTTTLEIVEGLREADGGEVTVLGMPPWPGAARRVESEPADDPDRESPHAAGVRRRRSNTPGTSQAPGPDGRGASGKQAFPARAGRRILAEGASRAGRDRRAKLSGRDDRGGHGSGPRGRYGRAVPQPPVPRPDGPRDRFDVPALEAP
jgi:energy-coupling factor transporter ATP-binding protein EcfA2